MSSIPHRIHNRLTDVGDVSLTRRLRFTPHKYLLLACLQMVMYSKGFTPLCESLSNIHCLSQLGSSPLTAFSRYSCRSNHTA
jgi:hypothetical protein